MELHDIIEIQRSKLNLTYEEIGIMVGVSKSTVLKWETGMIKNMRSDKILLLARVLQVTPTYLMGWNQESLNTFVEGSLTVGKRLKQRRIELNLTVDEVAKSLGKNRATIYRYENDEIESFPTTILKSLSKILDTTPINLIGWVEDQPEVLHTTLNLTPKEHAEIKFNVGDRLKNLRMKHSYTLEYVSSKLNLSKQTLQRYESGVIANIPSDKIEIIAEIYNTIPSYIMGWESQSMTIMTNATKDLTEEEQEKILDYVEYVKSKRKKDKY